MLGGHQYGGSGGLEKDEILIPEVGGEACICLYMSKGFEADVLWCVVFLMLPCD
jgi:hypothetical protein